MTIGEIKRAIEDANLPDDSETDVIEVIVKRAEYIKLLFYNSANDEVDSFDINGDDS